MMHLNHHSLHNFVDICWLLLKTSCTLKGHHHHRCTTNLRHRRTHRNRERIHRRDIIRRRAIQYKVTHPNVWARHHFLARSCINTVPEYTWDMLRPWDHCVHIVWLQLSTMHLIQCVTTLTYDSIVVYDWISYSTSTQELVVCLGSMLVLLPRNGFRLHGLLHAGWRPTIVRIKHPHYVTSAQILTKLLAIVTGCFRLSLNNLAWFRTHQMMQWLMTTL